MFECFHNFVAFSQWGNTLYNVMLKLSRNSGDPEAQAWFRKTMEGSFDQAGGAAFTPLECFVMELFRTISPNGGSISALEETRTPPYDRHGYIVTPHTATSMDPRHWEHPEKFDPDALQRRSDQPRHRRGPSEDGWALPVARSTGNASRSRTDAKPR